MKDSGSIPLRRTSLPNWSERCHESGATAGVGALTGSAPGAVAEPCAAGLRYASSCALSVWPLSRSASSGWESGEDRQATNAEQ
jgi:hypothetical protein